MATPYDDKVAVWHWKGDSLAEKTIEEFVRTLKQWAPHVKQVWVKTSDGSDWMSRWDKSAMAISGPDAIRRWVQVLEANGMEFHAWCVPKGIDIEAETNLIIAACTVQGVKSMILDVEPYAGFWRVGKDPIRPYMTRIRRGVGGLFHIGMSMDPRRHHYDSIFPLEWKPFINSLHPQSYWASFQRPVKEVMDEVYAVWGNFGLPIIPALQGNAEAAEIEEARAYCITKYGAKGLSYWRYGVIGPLQFPAINQPMSAIPEPEEPPADQGRYGKDIVVTPEDPRFSTGKHDPAATFQQFSGTWGWKVYYTKTRADKSTVWARWVPQITESGQYEVSVFIPARHAGTENARYKLHGVKGAAGEIVISIPQARYYNLWVPLGIYEFDANDKNAGIIFLNDLTGEAGKEIAYDAVRFRQLIGDPTDESYLADGYDAPIGTADERASEEVWPGYWIDVTGYAIRYFKGTPNEAYHTGADLNLNKPYFDADKDAPVYAAASGTVTYSNRLPGWGWVIVIRHDPLVSTRQVLYGRYAHVNDARVKIGDRVVRGQQIANVGNAEGIFAYHLHFDLSHTTVLERSPGDWPKLNLNRVLANYIDPREFVENNRPPRG
jgi:murein DD-endopeptidase MepM/ murein hydrolase activator NlpD